MDIVELTLVYSDELFPDNNCLLNLFTFWTVSIINDITSLLFCSVKFKGRNACNEIDDIIHCGGIIRILINRRSSVCVITVVRQTIERVPKIHIRVCLNIHDIFINVVICMILDLLYNSGFNTLEIVWKIKN